MVSLRNLDLETALARCGVACSPGAYASIAVKPVPRWLERMWGSGVEAMTLPNVVFVSAAVIRSIENGEAATLLAHEAVHVEQWREHGAVRFLTRYVGDYLRARAVGLPHRTAYRAIRFEREARQKAEKQ